MDFKKQCANCHAPLGDHKREQAFGGTFACSDECSGDLADMLDVVSCPADEEFCDEIKARGRTVDCDCTKYCEHCRSFLDQPPDNVVG